MTNVRTLFTTPNWPTTIALGKLERRVAALKKAGATKDEPSPPSAKPRMKSQ